jgi:hypothetical protein
MDTFHLWEEKYFYLIFYEHTPLSTVNIIEENHQAIMTTNFQLAYSLVVVFLLDPQLTFCIYMDGLLDIEGSIY